MKTSHGVGLLLLAISAGLGMVVPPLALLLPAAFLGLLLFFQFPELLALFAVAVGMLMSEDQMIRMGLPSVGLNLLDLVILMMPVVALTRWSELRSFVSRSKWITFLVWLLLAVGCVALFRGYVLGFPLRTAMRSYRFYVQLVVTYHFASVLGDPARQQRLVFGWMLLAPAQLFLLATHKVVYSPDDPGGLLFAPDIYWSNTHFLAVKSFYPLFLALAILAVGGRKRFGPLGMMLACLAGTQLVTLAFTYKRSQYVGAITGLATFFVGFLLVQVHRGRPWQTLSVRVAVFATLFLSLSGSFFALTLSSVQLNPTEAQENLERRFLFFREAETDAPIQERLEGMRIGWRDILRSPLLGTGLGDSATYIRAEIFHNGWLWIAVSAGLPAALCLLVMIGVALARTAQTLGQAAENSMLTAHRLGFLACLATLAGTAIGWGSTLDIADVMDWGLLLGLLCVSLPSQVSQERPRAQAADLPRVSSAQPLGRAR